MLFNNDILDAICDIELQFKIELDSVGSKSNALAIMMSGKWEFNYTNNSANCRPTYTTNDLLDALCADFAAGEVYILWWYIKHLVKTAKLCSMECIFKLLDRDDVAILFDYGGMQGMSIHNKPDFMQLLAMNRFNFDLLVSLCYPDPTGHESDILHLAMRFGDIDALKSCERRGISLTIDREKSLKYIPRLDVVQYMHKYNPRWFLGSDFYMEDVIYKCDSIINREVELTKWLISEMAIDVLGSLSSDLEYILCEISGNRDLTLMCWLIENYTDILVSESEYVKQHILLQTIAMMVPSLASMKFHRLSYSYMCNTLTTKPFEMFYRYCKGPVDIERAEIKYRGAESRTKALEYLVKQDKIIGFTKNHAIQLVSCDKLDAAKLLHCKNPELFDLETFTGAIFCPNVETLKWLKSCLDLSTPDKLEKYMTAIKKIYHVTREEVYFWLYTQINPVVDLSDSAVCIMLDKFGKMDYSFMDTISEESLKQLITVYSDQLGTSVLRNMRNANREMFDRCADHKAIFLQTTNFELGINMLLWLTYECGYKLPDGGVINEDSIFYIGHIQHKIYCDQNNCPFSVIYDIL